MPDMNASFQQFARGLKQRAETGQGGGSGA